MKNHGRLLVLMSLILLQSCSQLTQSLTAEKENHKLKVEIHKYKLDNGLKVLLIPNRRMPLISYYTQFEIGGRFERKGETGATHFLEHMLFKGTSRFADGTFERILDENGGVNNAYTENDSTTYYENFPSYLLEQILEMESDRMQNLVISPAAFENERKVVFEERKMRFENSPEGILYHQAVKDYFKGTNYESSIIGEESDLKSLTPEKLMNFYHTYYRPNNATLVIAGDFELTKLKKLIDEKYSVIKANPEIEKLKKEIDRDEAYVINAQLGRQVDLKFENENLIFSILTPGFKASDDKALVLDLLLSTINGGGSSYLTQKYVLNSQSPLTYLNHYNLKFKKSGAILLMGEMVKGKDFAHFKNEFLTRFPDMCREAVTEKALQKSKNQYLTRGFEHLKSNSGMAQLYLGHEAIFNDYNQGKKNFERILKMQTSEVLELCLELFSPDKVLVHTISK